MFSDARLRPVDHTLSVDQLRRLNRESAGPCVFPAIADSPVPAGSDARNRVTLAVVRHCVHCGSQAGEVRCLIAWHRSLWVHRFRLCRRVKKKSRYVSGGNHRDARDASNQSHRCHRGYWYTKLVSMSNECTQDSSESPKNRGGRPKRIDSPTVLTFKVPAVLAERVDSWAAARGLTRNQAGAELLTLALTPPSGGYNPQTGTFQ